LKSETKRTPKSVKNMKVTQRVFVSALYVGAFAALCQLNVHAQTNAAPAQTVTPAKTVVLAQTDTPSTNTPAQTPTDGQAVTAQTTKYAIKFAMAGTSSAEMQSMDDEDIRFHEGEWDLSPFATYVDKAGGKWGVGAAATYFILQNVGIGAATYWTDWKGTVFDNVEAEGYFRLPLLKVVAPYAVGSIGYQFDHDYWFETIGAGVDFRPLKNLSAFGDAQFRITNDGSKNGAFLRLGVRFSF
jgi:hypothetical protein